MRLTLCRRRRTGSGLGRTPGRRALAAAPAWAPVWRAASPWPDPLDSHLPSSEPETKSQ